MIRTQFIGGILITSWLNVFAVTCFWLLMLRALLVCPLRWLCRVCSSFPVADIDECALGGHSCPAGQDCENLPGSFRCVLRCGSGFRRTPDGFSCQGTHCSMLLLCN